jgi:hypothetical protein
MDFLDGVMALLTALGLKLKAVAASAFGAFISLRFFEGLSLWERWVTFLGGVVIGSYTAEPLGAAVESSSEALHQALALGLGLFGMAIAAAVIKVIRETNWGALVSSIVNFRSGGGK